MNKQERAERKEKIHEMDVVRSIMEIIGKDCGKG